MTVITASPTQFGKLLELQKGILDQTITQTIHADVNGQVLRNIREINHAQLTGQKDMIEGIRDDVIRKAELKVSEEQLIASQEAAENIKKMAVDLRKQAADNAKIITTIAGDMRLFKSGRENIGDKLKSAFGGLSNTLNTLGIIKKGSGGVLSNIMEKRDERKQYIKDQKLLGSKLSDKELAAQFSKAQQSAKNIEQNESAINRFKKMGLNESQIAKTEEGKKLLDKRVELAEDYSKYDLKANLMKEDDNNVSEQEIEAQKTAEETRDILRVIADNTDDKKDPNKIKPEKPEEGKGGFLDGIFSSFSNGFMKAIGSIFSPGNILKSLGKVFGITMIIGSLVNGLMDGFKEFAESGDIGKALIAGLGGVLSFLTFGLFDKETVQNIVDSVSGFVDEYLIKPLGNFFTNVKNGILELVSKIGIPEIKFTIPVINKEVSIGPYYPFADAAKQSRTPSAPEPTAANQVEAKSAENAEAAVQSPSGGNNTSVVAPTVNNVTKQTQIIKSPIRNQDSTMGKYVNSRYA